MTREGIFENLAGALDGADDRKAKASRIADRMRSIGTYRWVGIYEVAGGEIAVLGWSGPGAPAHPRFSAEEGLCGVAVRSRSTVVVGDVRKDPRYLVTFANTRSEIVVPVWHPRQRAVVGLIDVESERLNAFVDQDRILLEECASILARLWG